MTLMGSPLVDCEQLKDGRYLIHFTIPVLSTKPGKKPMPSKC